MNAPKQVASHTVPSVRESFPSAPAQHTHADGPVPTPVRTDDPLAPIIVLRDGATSEAERQAFAEILAERNALAALLLELWAAHEPTRMSEPSSSWILRVVDVARERLRAIREGAT